CISRQLWWGHQIPAWYAVSETGGDITDSTPFVVAMNEDEAREQAIAQFGPDVVLQQDPDVLDTWFSSGLCPFSTMGWPDETTKDFQTYYPTTTLVTGFDIIFFWVARMTMMAGHFTDTMPFETVYIHGLVRDENNQKMSKSKGNGIDPLVLINKYGTDALRYTLIREVAGAGQDIRLEYDRTTDESASVEASRNFTNKLWNASRFVMMNLGGQTPAQLGQPDAHQLELADKWILSRYHGVVQRVRNHVDKYGLGEAAKDLYDFIWGDFCDWYIELVKSRLQGEGPSKRVAQQTLAQVLDGILRLLHPFMPHITEEVWHTLNQAGEDQFLAVQGYPQVEANAIDGDLEAQFELLIGTIRTIRNLRAEAGIKPSAQIETILQSASAEERRILTATQVYIQDLAKVDTLTIRGEGPANAPQNGRVPAPSASPATAASGVDLAGIKAELTDFWVTMRPLLEEPLTYGNRFFSDFRRPAVTLLLLLVLLVTLQVLGAVLDTLNTIPLVGGVLKLVGMGYSLWFISQNLLSVDRRQATWAKLGAWKQQIVGQTQTWMQRPAPQPVVPQGQPEPVAAADPWTAPAAPQPEPAPQPKMFAGVVGTVQVLIPLTGVVDVDALRAKVEKDLGKIEAEAKALSGRLSNAKFVEKAPAEVVQGARDALAEAEQQAEMLRSRLKLL
ncbi:MAG: class I tRNA ligase family protein, partial [Leptolyngbya sp.]|nr:class I tRNA ligase family protein [Leptolyngbya sp.]